MFLLAGMLPEPAGEVTSQAVGDFLENVLLGDGLAGCRGTFSMFDPYVWQPSKVTSGSARRAGASMASVGSAAPEPPPLPEEPGAAARSLQTVDPVGPERDQPGRRHRHGLAQRWSASRSSAYGY